MGKKKGERTKKRVVWHQETVHKVNHCLPPFKLSDSASFLSFLAIDPRVLNSVCSLELPTLAFPQPLSMVIEKEVATSHSPLLSTHKAKWQTLCECGNKEQT